MIIGIEDGTGDGRKLPFLPKGKGPFLNWKVRRSSLDQLEDYLNVMYRQGWKKDSMYAENLPVIGWTFIVVWYRHNVRKEIAVPGRTLEDIEKMAIERAIGDNGGNLLVAARELKISKATMYRKMKEYRIDVEFVKAYGGP